MFVVRFDKTDLYATLNSALAGIKSSVPQILNDCGSRLVGLARIYFDTLSKGGQTVDGRQWMALKPETVKRREALARSGKLRGPLNAIGILTGRLQNSLTYRVAGNQLKVFYDDSNQGYFTHSRPLFPAKLPKEWRTECNQITQERLNVSTSAPRDFYRATRRFKRSK